jgi:hypothetical protein
MSTFMNKMKNESDKRFQILEKGLRDLIEQVIFFLKLFHDLILSSLRSFLLPSNLCHLFIYSISFCFSEQLSILWLIHVI